jgi:very-short-patch-repair endonuclease
MRHEPTDAEQRVWSLVRGRRVGHFKFRRQHPVAGYILDFYCDQAKLGVELDGGQHLDAAHPAADAKRTSDLASHSIRILRFWDDDVLKHPDTVAEHVYAARMCEEVGERTQLDARPHPNPLPEGEEGGEGERADSRGGSK